MKKISIKKAIDSGVWYKVSCKNFQGNFEYRLRMKRLELIDITAVDNIENVFPNVDLSNGSLWLLKLDLINMSKSHIDGWIIRNSVLLTDQDGFEFKNWTDYHFVSRSNYAVNVGIANLCENSHNPKIQFSAAIAFYLPKDEEAQYSVIIEDGNIAEV